MSAECLTCGADLVWDEKGNWVCPECESNARIKHLEAALREIADDCEDVTRSSVVSHAEARAWRALAAKAKAFLEVKP